MVVAAAAACWGRSRGAAVARAGGLLLGGCEGSALQHQGPDTGLRRVSSSLRAKGGSVRGEGGTDHHKASVKCPAAPTPAPGTA